MPGHLPLMAKSDDVEDDDVEDLAGAVDDEIRQAPEDETAGTRQIERPGSGKMFDRLEGFAKGPDKSWREVGTELGGVVEGIDHFLVDGRMDPETYQGRNCARHVTESA